MVFGGVNKKCVLHRACRVVGIEVQRVKVEPLALQPRPLGDLPPNTNKDVAHPVLKKRKGMPPPLPKTRGQRRDIHPLCRKPCRLFGRGNLSFAVFQCLRDPTASTTDELAKRGFLLWWHVAQLCVEVCKRGFVAGVLGRHCLESDRTRRTANCGERGVNGVLNVGVRNALGHRDRVYRDSTATARAGSGRGIRRQGEKIPDCYCTGRGREILGFWGGEDGWFWL